MCKINLIKIINVSAPVPARICVAKILGHPFSYEPSIPLSHDSHDWRYVKPRKKKYNFSFSESDISFRQNLQDSRTKNKTDLSISTVGLPVLV